MEMIIQRFTQTLMWPSGSSLISISRYKLKLGSNITKLKIISFFFCCLFDRPVRTAVAFQQLPTIQTHSVSGAGLTGDSSSPHDRMTTCPGCSAHSTLRH